MFEEKKKCQSGWRLLAKWRESKSSARVGVWRAAGQAEESECYFFLQLEAIAEERQITCMFQKDSSESSLENRLLGWGKGRSRDLG